MRTLAVAAQKGGVGKTTSAVYLGAALARRGLRVLVVDLDPQGAATALLAPPADWSQPNQDNPTGAARGTAAVLLDGIDLARAVAVSPAGPRNLDAGCLDLCPAWDDLGRAELALAAEVGREALLARALQAAPRDRWDLAILDCPPSLGLLTVNALVAADAVLVPVAPAFLSLRAVRDLEATAATVRGRLNRRLREPFFLLCAVDARERLAAESREALRTHAGARLLRQAIRVDARVKAAPEGDQLPRGRAARDYEAAAVELLKRLDVKTSKR